MQINDDGTVTISKAEYIELQEAAEKLSALECQGVDNWEGYDDAMWGCRELDHETLKFKQED